MSIKAEFPLLLFRAVSLTNQSSIRSRLLSGLLVVTLLPLGAIFVGSEYLSNHALRRSEYQKLNDLSAEVARQLASTMESAANHLDSLVTNPVVSSPKATIEERMVEVSRLVQIYTQFSDITLLDREGFVIGTTAENHLRTRDESTWFAFALAGGAKAVSDPYFAYGEEGLFLSVYLPVRVDHEVAFVAMARVRFDHVWSLIDGVQIGRGGYMELVDDFGNVLASKDKTRILEKYDLSQENLSFPVDGIQKGLDGKTYLMTSRLLSPLETQVGHQWVVLAFEPLDEIRTVLVNNRYLQFAVALTGLLLAYLIGRIIAQWLSQPLEEAAATAERVHAGDTVVTMSGNGPREVGRLAEAFNRMLKEIREHRSNLEGQVIQRTQSLHELAAQLRATYESIQEGILVIRPDGHIVTANSPFREFFAVPDEQLQLRKDGFEVGNAMASCFADGEGFQNLWRRLISSSTETIDAEEWQTELPVRRTLALYSAPVLNENGEQFARLWMFRDLTEQRQLQLSLQQATKMEAVGRLAGGIAHDFNNLLTGIIGNFSVLEMEGVGSREDDSLEMRRALKLGKTAASRAADLVKQLLGFSRKNRLELKRCEINEIVDEVCSLMERTIDPRIEIDMTVKEDLWTVQADATQIQQILMNLCTNARDALPDGGRIHLYTENVSISEPAAIGTEIMPEGDYVHFWVQDNGEGIPDNVVTSIFEPFFTTKAEGRGTGLGLANCYGIVKQHGGWIGCESILGQGSAFHIYLPKDSVVQEERGIASAPEVHGIASGEGETILIVDDEQVVRMVGETVLRKRGFNVLCAEDGQEAADLFQGRLGRSIDLVLLDLTMPRLSGRDTLKAIRASSDVPVLICSGYEINLDEFADEVGVRPEGFVQKPYDTDALVRTISATLAVNRGKGAVSVA